MRLRLALVADRANQAGAASRLVLAAALIGALLLVVLLTFRFASDGRYETLLSTIGITAIAVIGYQVFVGNTGIISFGHPAFMALGAYTAGVLTMPVALKPLLLPDLPSWLAGFDTGPLVATLAGGLLALALALAVGPAVMRLSGATAGIMTFGLLVIVNEVIRNATSITKGTQTFFGIPRTIGSASVYVALAIAAMLAVAFKFSAAGLRARAVRDDALAAGTLGIDVVRARLWAWALSAFICGVAGALLAQYLTAFSASSFYVTMLIPMLLMAVLGGMQSVLGALVGTVVIACWQQFMRSIEGDALGAAGWVIPPGLSDLTLGLGLLLLLRLRPQGLLGNLELTFSRAASATDARPPSSRRSEAHG